MFSVLKVLLPKELHLLILEDVTSKLEDIKQFL